MSLSINLDPSKNFSIRFSYGQDAKWIELNQKTMESVIHSIASKILNPLTGYLARVTYKKTANVHFTAKMHYNQKAWAYNVITGVAIAQVASTLLSNYRCASLIVALIALTLRASLIRTMDGSVDIKKVIDDKIVGEEDPFQGLSIISTVDTLIGNSVDVEKNIVDGNVGQEEFLQESLANPLLPSHELARRLITYITKAQPENWNQDFVSINGYPIFKRVIV
ncbi:MAG: hypothetical protein QRY72_05605 [Candidatus Rhabdochlamydia sp.]